MTSPQTQLSASHTMRPAWPVWTSLILIGLLAFWPTVWFDFVNWDDPYYVWKNDLIKSWSPASLYGIATETVTRNYAPLTIGSLLIDHTLWGMQPGGYHATNVILHLLNGLLVFVLTRQLTGSRFVGWLTAALFLCHPVQIETVAWISSRKGLLSATFILAALIVRLRPSTTTAPSESGTASAAGLPGAPAFDAGQDLWYLIWLGAALLSKALAVVVPAIVLMYDVLVERKRFSEALVRQVIPGLMSLMLLLKTMSAQHTILGGLRGHMDLSLLQIIAVDLTILWRYIGMLVWPSNLCVLYDPPTSGILAMTAVSGLGWVAVGTALWKSRHRAPMLLWSALTSLVLLLPVLNFFRITTLMNDRYLYLPSILFFAVIARTLEWTLSTVRSRNNDLAPVFAGITRWSVSAAMVVGMLLCTSRHLPVWRNSFTLWNHAMTEVPQLAAVRMQLALTHYDTGQTRHAVHILQKALLECDADTLDRERMQKARAEWTQELTRQTSAVFRPHH